MSHLGELHEPRTICSEGLYLDSNELQVGGKTDGID